MNMRQELVTLLGLGVLGTAAMGILSLLRPDDSQRIIGWWLIGLSCIALIAAASILGKLLPIYRRPARKRRAGAKMPHSGRPERVVQIERMVTSAKWSQREFRARLRPLLAVIAAHRLQSYRNIDPRTDPQAAQQALGHDVWVTLETTVSAPGDDGPGMSVGAVNRIVTTLEGIGGPARTNS